MAQLLAYRPQFGWIPRFAPDLERAFREDYAIRSIPFVRSFLSIGAAIWLSFLPLVPRLFPRNAFPIYVLNGVVMPLILLFFLALTYFNIYRRWGQPFAFAQAASIALGLFYLVLIADSDEPAYAINWPGLGLLVQTAFVLGRLRLPATLSLSIFVVCGYAFVCLVMQGRHHSPDELTVFLNNSLYLIASVTGSTVSAYLLEIYIRRDFIRRRELEAERNKGDRLLRSILPDEVADRLRDGAHSIADSYDDVSVLFCGVVGLAPLAERSTPGSLVALLNEVFTWCDELAEKHGVERIKTIGDIYVAASGVPVPRDDHAGNLARFALEMRDLLLERFREREPGLTVRIGICSGPVIGGIIGQRRFTYDLWGETVDIAAGMEAHGLIGEIQVACSTYGLLRERCRFEPRGRIRLAGKESVEAYLLKSFITKQQG